MRVAQVVPDLDPASGGPATNVPRLSMALARLGVEVELHWVGALPEPWRDTDMARLPGLSLYPAAPAWPQRLRRSPGLRRHLLDSRCDLVHAHCLWQRPLGYALAAAQTRRRPLVISPRGMLNPWPLRRSRLKKLLARALVHPGAFARAAGWHATAESEAGHIRALGFRQPICIAPNGIEAPRDDGDSAHAHYLARWPELRDRRVLLFYSRFHPKKRIRELLDDFAALAAARPEWHLLAVGLPEGHTVDALRAQARTLGIEARCTIVDGRHEPKPYALAELFVLPSHDENFGSVVAEALAAGVPVLTTTGTPWEHLDGLRAGAWVEPDRFRDALARLTAHAPEALRAAGARGRRYVLETFEWARVAARLRDFYAERIQRARAEAPTLPGGHPPRRALRADHPATPDDPGAA